MDRTKGRRVRSKRRFWIWQTHLPHFRLRLRLRSSMLRILRALLKRTPFPLLLNSESVTAEPLHILEEQINLIYASCHFIREIAIVGLRRGRWRSQKRNMSFGMRQFLPWPKTSISWKPPSNYWLQSLQCLQNPRRLRVHLEPDHSQGQLEDHQGRPQNIHLQRRLGYVSVPPIPSSALLNQSC